MDERSALLANILANPADDTARLVFADWLQENGEGDRAEFIRVQVELAQWEVRDLEANADHNRLEALLTRERELFALDNSQGWNGFLIDDLARHILEHRMEEDAIWRRGFIDELHTGTDGCDVERVLQLLTNPAVVLTKLTLSAADWLTHAATIRAAHPVTAVKFSSRRLAGVGEINTGPHSASVPVLVRLRGRGTWRPFREMDTLGDGNMWLGCFRDEWPGITFTLPT